MTDAESGSTFWYNLLSTQAAGFTPSYSGKNKIRIYIQICLVMNILVFSKVLLKLHCCVYSVNKREVLYSVLSFLSFTWQSFKREEWGQVAPSCQTAFLILCFLVIQWILKSNIFIQMWKEAKLLSDLSRYSKFWILEH